MEISGRQPLLHHHGVARVAEAPLVEAGRQCRERVLAGVADGNPLAGGEAVRLDHAAPVELEDEVEEVAAALPVPGAPTGGGDTGPIHDLLGVRLAPLDLGGGRRGSEDGQARRVAGVGDARGERRIGTDHDQVDLPLAGQAGQRRPIGDRHRERRHRARRCRRCQGRRRSRVPTHDGRRPRRRACSRPPEPTTRMRIGSDCRGSRPSAASSGPTSALDPGNSDASEYGAFERGALGWHW